MAARSGLSRKALRLYEAKGVLPPPARTESGYRAYGHEVLALLRFIARARRMGFSLAEIRDIAAIRRSSCLCRSQAASTATVAIPCTPERPRASRRLKRDARAHSSESS